MRWTIFAKEALLYTFTLAVGLWAAHFHAFMAGSPVFIQPFELNLQSVVIFVIVFTLFTWFLLRMARASIILLRIVLALALIGGMEFVLYPWVRFPLDVILMLGVLFVFWRIPLVITHNIVVALGIAGFASALGVKITPIIAVSLLSVFALYDIIAVYRSRHMVTLAHRMIQSGAVFGFIVPERWSQFFWPRRDAIVKGNAIVLGSGDIGLPLVLAASSVSTSLSAAVVVGITTLVGLLGTHYLFMHQHGRRPMAALPPIATAAIAGYLLAVLAGL